MNDAMEWIDPELVAAGQLLQSRGLVAPDRTQAPLSQVRAAVDRIGAFLGEGSVLLAPEHDLSCRGRMAKCRAASICRTTRSGRRCSFTPMAAVSCRELAELGRRCCASSSARVVSRRCR
jgi:hypothetical protein